MSCLDNICLQTQVAEEFTIFIQEVTFQFTPPTQNHTLSFSRNPWICHLLHGYYISIFVFLNSNILVFFVLSIMEKMRI